MAMKSLEKRTTIRKYTEQDITDDLLNSLLEKAARTQTMGNLQLYSVVVTRDEEMKKALAPAHFHQPMVTQAPVLLTFCADFRRTTVWAENRNANPGYDNFLSFINATTDALLYMQTFCNLAEEEGMGYCFLGTTIYNPQSIIETLQLPPLVMPIAALSLGWPDEQPALTNRLPLRSFIHQETYKDYTPESINNFYQEKEQLQENIDFVKLNNKETLAQVYTDLKYTKKDNEKISETLIEALRQQGFLSL